MLCNAGRFSVCLSVCLSVSNFIVKSNENFTTAVSVHKEDLIKFWKSSASGSGYRNFFRILQHCEIGHFSTISIVGLSIFMNISSQMYVSLDKEVAIKFWK